MDELKVGTDQFVEHAFSSLLKGDPSRLRSYNRLLGQLTMNEQGAIIFSLLRIFWSRLPSFDADILDTNEETPAKKIAAGATALILKLIKGYNQCSTLLVDWLNGTAAISANRGIYMIRVVIAALAQDQGTLPELLSDQSDQMLASLRELIEKSLSLFSDTLYIKHTPIIQQEGL